MTSWRQSVVATCLLLACACAQAAVHAHVESLEVPGAHMSGIDVNLTLAANGLPQMQLDIAKMTVPALGWRDVTLALHGEPRPASAGGWKFAGHVKTVRAPGGLLDGADLAIEYDPDSGTLEVDVRQGKGVVHALMPLDQATHVQMTLTALPLTWLRGVLAASWPAGRLDAGTVSGEVAVDLAAGGTRISGRAQLAGVGLDSKAGNIAATQLAAAGSFRIENGLLATDLMFDGVLKGGQMLLGPLYAQLPAHDVNLHVSATLGPGGIAVRSLEFDDPGALRVTGSLGFDRSGSIDRLALTRFAATFPAAYARYGTTLVQSFAGIKDVGMSGSIAGALDIGAGGLDRIDLDAENLSIDSHGGSLAVAGLTGKVDWRAGASRPASTIGWQSLSVYGIALGPARLGLADEGGTLTLRQPVSAAVLGGALQMNRLAWRPGSSGSPNVSAAFSVTGINLPELCKAFGWPQFAGTLGGAVPGLSYHAGRLVFEGGLSLQVFDGAVSVTDLSMRHPFGPAPELAADIAMRQLDLAQLTDVFDFGQITGRLDGDIQGLELVDWKPTAFNADLTANGGGKISQHALKSLTEVGGGGIGGGLQGMALRLFKTFGYSRLGLSCKLLDGVCTMGGINPDPDPSGDGYTIVEGSGLPRITVIGHQHAVDWATLVSRLKAATEGGGPVVR